MFSHNDLIKFAYNYLKEKGYSDDEIISEIRGKNYGLGIQISKELKEKHKLKNQTLFPDLLAKKNDKIEVVIECGIVKKNKLGCYQLKK